MRNKFCMFTGHRVIPPECLETVKNALYQKVRELICNGVTDFIAGGALGFDMMAEICIINMKREFPNVKLHMYLPCKEQDKGWKRYDKLLYAKINKMADEVIYTGEKYTSGCMHERNRRMVAASDVCIAFLKRNVGGTAYTVNYAKQNGLEVIII